jgi:hypothetical protein
MHNLETRFSVPQSPDQVWSMLIDYPSYARWRNASGGTDVVHGENFKGLLVGVIKLERIKGEYERMNRDMVAEIARRYPVSTGA